MGPNMVDWKPSRNSTASSSGRLLSQKPMVAIAMMVTSNSLMPLICRDFSYLSANWPNSAENRKKGRMNTMALRLISWSVLSPASRLLWNTSRAASAFLKMLSLSAPSAWVMKNGMKRRARNRANWEVPDTDRVGQFTMPVSTPAMVAVIMVASAPPSTARRPNRARSGRRSGARPPMPPSWMAMDAKFANPHSA